MTVVARLAINDYPMLIGDLLLSVEDPSASPSPVPTAENLAALFPTGSPCVPCGLRQKVAVVADNLVVGWSGALDAAQDVIAELKRKSGSQPFTHTSLMEHCDSLPRSVWDDVSLVGHLEEPKGQVLQWGRGEHWIAETKLFGKVALLGSGLDDVEKTLLNVPHLPVGLDRTLLGPEQALGFCLQMTGNLMQLEIATRKSLEDFYGGGYEIATVIDEKYQKVDDITYMFWRAGLEENGVRIAYGPYKTLHYSYINDLLVIRSVSFDVTTATPSVTGEQSFYVEPVYRDASPAEIAAIKPHTLNARNLCVYFLLPAPKGVAVLAAVHRKSYPTDEKWVKFTESAAGVTGISVERDFLETVAKEIQRELRPIT